MSESVKVWFPFTNDQGGTEQESMWTVRRGEHFVIDNIPFYVMELAVGDVIEAPVGEDGRPHFSRLVAEGGHSTVRLIVYDRARVSETRAELERRGCSSEISDVETLIALDVPPEVPYESIKSYLDDGMAKGYFDYEEACLAT